MYYTSTQAAQFLGISRGVLKKLVVSGVIKDHGVTKEGCAKHELRLSLAELKVYKKEKGLVSKKVADPFIHPSNRRKQSIANFPGSGILARLDRIESKLDDLLKVWS